MWKCKKCGSKRIGIREDVVHSSSYFAKIDKNGLFETKRKFSKTAKECNGQTFECLDCGNTGDCGDELKYLESIAEWED